MLLLFVGLGLVPEGFSVQDESTMWVKSATATARREMPEKHYSLTKKNPNESKQTLKKNINVCSLFSADGLTGGLLTIC